MKFLPMFSSLSLVLLAGLGAMLWGHTHPSYSNDWLSVQAPDGRWRLSSSSNAGVAYATDKNGRREKAFVSMIALPPDLSPEAMVDFVRDEALHDPRIANMKVVESAFDYSVARGYPCVQHRLTVRVPQSLRLRQQQALTCRHPGRPGTGIVMGFSVDMNAGLPDSSFDRQAQSFFERVTLRLDVGVPQSSVASIAH
ncbi:MAG: hypothetical protein QM766_03935 [Burkholderiaceae bacterium]